MNSLFFSSSFWPHARGYSSQSVKILTRWAWRSLNSLTTTSTQPWRWEMGFLIEYCNYYTRWEVNAMSIALTVADAVSKYRLPTGLCKGAQHRQPLPRGCRYDHRCFMLEKHESTGASTGFSISIFSPDPCFTMSSWAMECDQKVGGAVLQSHFHLLLK
jgi:hypothetical protein